MKVLSLFSGGGLGDYGLTLAGMEIVGQVEIDEYCQKILSLRWPDVPKWKDIKNVTGKEILERVGTVDLISGGFPCQPFSVAGSREGEKDSRHLWPHMARIIREVKPRWVLAENVPGLLSISNGRVFGEVLRDLAESGYVVEWDCVPASACGAPHRRDRVWIVGYAEHSRQSAAEITRSIAQRSNHRKAGKIKAGESSGSGEQRSFVADADQLYAQRSLEGINDSEKRKESRKRSSGFCGNDVANTDSTGLQAPRPKFFTTRPVVDWEQNHWSVEPNVGRVAHGVANRVDRLKLLGNGQVVQVVEWIGKQIMQHELNQGAM